MEKKTHRTPKNPICNIPISVWNTDSPEEKQRRENILVDGGYMYLVRELDGEKPKTRYEEE